jgi:hypothetical protein
MGTFSNRSSLKPIMFFVFTLDNKEETNFPFFWPGYCRKELTSYVNFSIIVLEQLKGGE